MKQKYYLIISAGLLGYWLVDGSRPLKGRSWATLTPTPDDREAPYRVVLLGNFEGNLFTPGPGGSKCYRSLESFTSEPNSAENFHTGSIPENLVNRLLLLAEL